MDDYLTAKQAAAILKLHVKRVQALARIGTIPAVRVQTLNQRAAPRCGRPVPALVVRP